MRPTNLLFVLSDEHNRDCLGCYGHPLVQTPNLDRLAARGVRFTAAYCNCPICVPSRASLATGRYVHEIGYWDNAFPYDGRVRGWGHRLIDAGHRVDAIGKLHFRSIADADGFTRKILPLNVVDGVGDVMGSIRDDLPSRRGTREGVTSAGPGRSTYLDYDEEIAARACEWLADAARRRDEPPWVLFTSFVCPHPPFIAPPDLYALYPLEAMPLPVQNRLEDQPHHPALDNLRRAMQYDEPFDEDAIRRVTAAYYGACTHLDRQVGRVLAALHEHGLAGTTRVIYTSDHGESMGRRGLWGKFTMYEESVAVPLIVAGPDVPQGGVSADPVSLVDAYPTILEAAGLPLTDDDRNHPGRSWWSIAAGHPLHRAVLSEYHAVASTTASYMLRSGRFKLVFYVGYPPQLFDLAADPDECRDLAALAEYQPVVSNLERQLRARLDPEATDARAKADQRALVERHGGREAVLAKGTFVNSPVPGETPTYHPGGD
jgi:choline-sulfatase